MKKSLFLALSLTILSVTARALPQYEPVQINISQTTCPAGVAPDSASCTYKGLFRSYFQIPLKKVPGNDMPVKMTGTWQQNFTDPKGAIEASLTVTGDVISGQNNLSDLRFAAQILSGDGAILAQMYVMGLAPSNALVGPGVENGQGQVVYTTISYGWPPPQPGVSGGN